MLSRSGKKVGPPPKHFGPVLRIEGWRRKQSQDNLLSKPPSSKTPPTVAGSFLGRRIGGAPPLLTTLMKAYWRILVILFLWTAACWLVIGGLLRPLLPGGWLTVLAL